MFGFCKFLETCRSKHNNETCSDNSCEIEKCSLRHPRECRYFRVWRRCWFCSSCFYYYEVKTIVQKDKLEDDIVKMKDKQIEINERIQLLDQLIYDKSRELSALETAERIFYPKQLLSFPAGYFCWKHLFLFYFEGRFFGTTG